MKTNGKPWSPIKAKLKMPNFRRDCNRRYTRWVADFLFTIAESTFWFGSQLKLVRTAGKTESLVLPKT